MPTRSRTLRYFLENMASSTLFIHPSLSLSLSNATKGPLFAWAAPQNMSMPQRAQLFLVLLPRVAEQLAQLTHVERRWKVGLGMLGSSSSRTQALAAASRKSKLEFQLKRHLRFAALRGNFTQGRNIGNLPRIGGPKTGICRSHRHVPGSPPAINPC